MTAGRAAAWQKKHETDLANADLKNGLKLLWFGTGKDDFLVKTTEATVDLLKKRGFDVVYKESEGGHTWLNWRDYLNEFAPALFQEGGKTAAATAKADTASLDGKWTAEFDTQIGVQKYVWTLTTHDGRIEGTAKAEIGGESHDSKITSGKIDGNAVNFVEEIDFQGNALEYQLFRHA